MFDRIRALLHRLHEVNEVDSLTDRDLADLGMSRSQLREFLRMPHDISERVTAMGAIFGVPEAALRRDHGEWVELLTTCGHCTERRTCARVLSLGPEVDPASVDFCGNSEVFATLVPRAA